MVNNLDQHYTDMGIEPITYSDSNKLDPYQHTVIKYVTRWRAKGGIRDLKAAQLILQKYIDKEEKLVLPDEKLCLLNIIEAIQSSNRLKYDRIVTVGRGGMWAAANLAYALNIDQVETMQIRDINQLSHENILFVDGIVDTGKTIANMMIDSAALYTRDTTEKWPTYTGAKVTHKEYVEMPMSTPLDKGN